MARRGIRVSGGTRERDPFALDEDRALEDLARTWGAYYLVSADAGRWFAVRRNGTGDAIIAATPGELAAAMGSAWHGSVR